MIREALVVGINSYCNNFKQLNTPAGDAEAIAQLLKQYGEFQKITRLPLCNRGGEHVVDPDGVVTAPQLREELERLFKPESDNVPGTALFFFAGHGHRVKNQNGQYEGFLATSESHLDPKKDKLGLSLQWLRELLQDSPVREQVVWLDSCHSGEFLNNFEKATFKGHDCCFIVASREHEEAHQHPNGKHGMLSGVLLEGLDPKRMDKRIVNSSDLKSFIDDQKGLSQLPVCSVFGQSIELTRRQNPFANFVKKYWLRLTTVGIMGVVAVAIVFYNGNSPDSPKKEIPATIESLQEVAEQGNPKAQTELGLVYYQGQLGAPTNYDTAFNWFDKAAKKGYPEAKYHLSWMYAKGQYVSKDEKKALELLTESANGGYGCAAYLLSTVYDAGSLGVPQDQKLSHHWLNLTNKLITHPKSISLTCTIPIDKEWLRKKVKEGNEDARLILATLDEMGTVGGVVQWVWGWFQEETVVTGTK